MVVACLTKTMITGDRTKTTTSTATVAASSRSAADNFSRTLALFMKNHKI